MYEIVYIFIYHYIQPIIYCQRLRAATREDASRFSEKVTKNLLHLTATPRNVEKQTARDDVKT